MFRFRFGMAFLRFYKGLGYPSKHFSIFGQRDLKMQKSASGYSLAVLAILSYSFVSLYPYYNSEGLKWPLS